MRTRLVFWDAVRLLQRAFAVACLGLFLTTSFVVGAEAETRKLKLYNTHTKERVTITFKRNGRYLAGGLREANRFLRDWRRNEITKIDPELLDLVWEVYREVGAKDYIYVVSSYRSPATNNMLRGRSSGVAKNSQHTLGKAMDFYIPGVNLGKLRATGLRKHVGGVGYYPKSGSPFVHMDTGRVRHWPRMTRKQLARVFPNGRTLHVPSDGKPMAGYQLALAQSKSRDTRSSKPVVVAESRPRPRSTNRNDDDSTAPIPPASGNRSGEGGGNLLANLFGRQNSSETETPAPPGAVRPPRTNEQVLTNPDPDPDPIIVASVAPRKKPEPPQPEPIAASEPPPPPGTLDAQRVALESGQPVQTSVPRPATVTASDPEPAPAPQVVASAVPVPLPEASRETETITRFDAAALPQQKPNSALTMAALVARNSNVEASGLVTGSPAADSPVAAIAAATQSPEPRPTVEPVAQPTLAYASPSATPAQRPAASQVSGGIPEPGLRPTATAAANALRTNPVATRHGKAIDPLAGFHTRMASTSSMLLMARRLDRYQDFSRLLHPDQRGLDAVMQPGNRFYDPKVTQEAIGTLSTNKASSPAVTSHPIALVHHASFQAY